MEEKLLLLWLVQNPKSRQKSSTNGSWASFSWKLYKINEVPRKENLTAFHYTLPNLTITCMRQCHDSPIIIPTCVTRTRTRTGLYHSFNGGSKTAATAQADPRPCPVHARAEGSGSFSAAGDCWRGRRWRESLRRPGEVCRERLELASLDASTVWK